MNIDMTWSECERMWVDIGVEIEKLDANTTRQQMWDIVIELKQ